MANASCSNCTLVSNLLTLVGAVSGSVVVGMTITGAGVPPGVTITSLGTGTGQAGTYNCSSSAANVTVAEAMVFSLSWNMPLVGNTQIPQLADADLARAAGFGLVILSAFGGGTAGPGQEYQHGTHAAALYNAQALSGTNIYHSVNAKEGAPISRTVLTLPQYVEPPQPTITKTATRPSEVTLPALQLITATPQIVDLTIQPWITTTFASESFGWTAEYQFGTHQKALYDSQGGSVVFGSVRTPPSVASGFVPLQTIVANPQELSRDLTLQGFSSIPSVPQGWIITMITAGPQGADLTLQATLSPAQPFHSAAPPAPTNPTFFSVRPQDDPTQIPARLIKPPAVAASFKPILQVFAAPDRQDYTQPQGQVLYTSLPGPAKYVQPAYVWAFEQQYDKTWQPQILTQPLVFIPPVVPPPALGPPDISVWTTDSSSITADSVAFTCDGADLVNLGSVQVPGLAGRPAYSISSPAFTPPIPGASLTNNVPLPVVSPPQVYYINGIAYFSGQRLS